MTESRLVVTWVWGRVGQAGGKDLKGHKATCRDCRHDHDLDSGDGFTGVYLYQNLSNHSLHVQSPVCLLYLNKALFKNGLAPLHCFARVGNDFDYFPLRSSASQSPRRDQAIRSPARIWLTYMRHTACCLAQSIAVIVIIHDCDTIWLAQNSV